MLQQRLISTLIDAYENAKGKSMAAGKDYINAGLLVQHLRGAIILPLKTDVLAQVQFR